MGFKLVDDIDDDRFKSGWDAVEEDGVRDEEISK
jgi:hypothetical protein